jgi:hypothetical protein
LTSTSPSPSLVRRGTRKTFLGCIFSSPLSRGRLGGGIKAKHNIKKIPSPGRGGLGRGNVYFFIGFLSGSPIILGYFFGVGATFWIKRNTLFCPRSSYSSILMISHPSISSAF